MNGPKIIIADEPTGNLDPTSSEKIMDILVKLNQEEEVTIVMVTHNLSLIKKYPERVIILRNGILVNDIPKSQISGYLGKAS